MLKKVLFSLLFLIFSVNYSIADTDVVYPTSVNSTINAPRTFLFGSVDNGAELYINSEKVPLYENNFFVYVVPLNYGKNDIVFTSYLNGEKTDKIYHVTRNKPVSSSKESKKSAVETPSQCLNLISKTVKDNSTLRTGPSSSCSRAGELPKNIVLYLSDKKGDYYKIDAKGENFWIHHSNISKPHKADGKNLSLLQKKIHYFDSEYEYFKFCLSYPVPFKISQNEQLLELKLFGVRSDEDLKSGILTFKVKSKTPVLGYEGYYEGNNFILRKALNPQIYSAKKPLKGISIFVDAGHGGKEKGALGPTRVCEKDINLSIALNLIQLLKKDGAKVSYSRIEDITVPLYDRVKKAKENDALISLSIHNNSLPPGGSPYEKHGTEVHYYNENAKLLSEIINNNLSEDSGLRKNGIHRSSFALNRSTNPVSVLIEVAYMINPEEYIFLKNSATHKKIAESLERSIIEYVNIIKKQ